MSTVQSDNKVIAILCSDIHLSMNPPVARSAESDWFEAMKRSLNEISNLSIIHNNAPILCAGDIFDRWNSPPELINFALDWLPKMYAIPGQHDLPHHRFDLMDRSPFGTLVRAKHITLVTEEISITPNLFVTGYPWGMPLPAVSNSHKRKNKGIHLALCHHFVWTSTDAQTSYPGAPDSASLHNLIKNFRGFDVVVFGDNHHGFLLDVGDVRVLNCGTVFRRTLKEMDYQPRVGLLFDNGYVVRQPLDISQDVFTTKEIVEKRPENLDIQDFIKNLKNLSADPLDFRAALVRIMRDCDADVQIVLQEALDAA